VPCPIVTVRLLETVVNAVLVASNTCISSGLEGKLDYFRISIALISLS